jgi:hypothetical protein
MAKSFFSSQKNCYVHTHILSHVGHVFINSLFFFVRSICFGSIMTTVANLKINTALISCRILEVASCPCYPGLAYHYDSRQCLNVAGPDKPTRILPQILSKDILKSVWLFIQTSVALSVHWLRQVMRHCS